MVLSKAKLRFPSSLLIYNQDGVDISFNILTIINSTKTVFIHGQSVIGTYYHPGSKILALWTVSRTDYPSVTTKLVPQPPRCDTHLGEMSIHQIQIQTQTLNLTVGKIIFSATRTDSWICSRLFSSLLCLGLRLGLVLI